MLQFRTQLERNKR